MTEQWEYDFEFSLIGQPFILVQVLIYINRMVKRISKKGNEEEKMKIKTAKESILSILDPRLSEQVADFIKI